MSLGDSSRLNRSDPALPVSDFYQSGVEELSDSCLFEGILGDRAEYLEILYKRYYEGLVGYSAGLTQNWDDAEDIVQEVYLKIWNNRSNLSREVLSVKAYLFGAVRNASLNRLRGETRVRELHFKAVSSGASIPASELLADERIERLNEIESVKSLVDSLPERQQSALVLYYVEDMNFADIGRALDISDVAARKLVRKAEARLRDIFI